MDEQKGDLPVSVIIIVACVCGSIVIILSIILIVLCCRRHQAKKAYEQEAANRITVSPPVMTHTDTAPDKLSRSPPPNGFENRGLDSIDLDDFSPDSGNPPPAYPGRSPDKKQSPHKPNKMKKPIDESHLGSKLDSHGSHDSGMSTPEGHKPKKVIYEVIV